MSKSKTVADEAKKRIKHVFTRDAGIHEGVYRDEPGWFNSYYHPYCFGYGYFFHLRDHVAKSLSPEYIKENWDKHLWLDGLQNHCIAYVDRRRKIAVINRNLEYAYSIQYALPYGYNTYVISEHIPCTEITSSKNRMLLIKAYMRTLIKDYLDTFYYEYRIIVNKSKCKYCPDPSSYRNKLFTKIKELYESNKRLPYNKPLQSEYKVRNEVKIKFPSICQILTGNLFTNEERHYLDKCNFYTKYCYRKDISWSETDKYYDIDTWVKDVIAREKQSVADFENRIEICKQQCIDSFLSNNEHIDEWRNGNTDNIKKPYNININYHNRTVRRSYVLSNFIFPNVQLRIKRDKSKWVETSRGAIVPLAKAIELFNHLYMNYMIYGTTNTMFEDSRTINKFKVISLTYCDKYDDVYNKSLGYYEYKIVIGCHTLWFDDIKNFAKYYNLQKYLCFPIDKTTDECINNFLINANVESYE